MSWGEGKTSFRLLPLEEEIEEDECILLQTNTNFRNLETLRRGTESSLRKMLARLEKLVPLISEHNSVRLAGCGSLSVQLVSCAVAGIKPQELTEEESAANKAVEDVCAKLNPLRNSRQARGNILQMLIFDSMEQLSDLTTATNALIFNQNTIERNIQLLARNFETFTQSIYTRIQNIQQNLRQVNKMIISLQAFSEIRNVAQHFSVRQMMFDNQMGRELNVMRLNLNWFQRELNLLVRLLAGGEDCRFSQDLQLLCTDGGASIRGADGNDFVLGTKATRMMVKKFLAVTCLPYRGRLSTLSGKIWLEHETRLIRGNESVAATCLYREDLLDRPVCDGTQGTAVWSTQFYGEAIPGAADELVEDTGIFVLIGKNGVYLNTLSEEPMKVIGRSREIITLNWTPVFVGWEKFPVVVNGYPVSKSSIQVEGAEDLDSPLLLETYQPKNYQLNLDGFQPSPQSSEEHLLKRLAWDIETLIKNSPVVQVVSGTGIFLILAAIAVGILICVKVESVRTALRSCFCCLCQKIQSGDLGARVAAERQHWGQYQAIRRQGRAEPRERSRGRRRGASPPRAPPNRAVSPPRGGPPPYHRAVSPPRGPGRPSGSGGAKRMVSIEEGRG